jgi:hypothetical protein
MKRLTRRDFLKATAGALAGAFIFPKLYSPGLSADTRPNIIVLVMDSLSARHVSLYGYPRLTTPNIDAFAASSTVFHNHHSAGNFTTTAVGSMMTGMIPWKHRALNGGGLLAAEVEHITPYALLGPEYYRFSFSQTPYADIVTGQAYRDIDRLLSPFSFSLL